MRLEHVMYRLEQQVSQSRRLSAALENFMQGPITPQRIDVRLQAVTEQWEEFEAFHKALTLAVSRLESDARSAVQHHSYFSSNLFDRTYECYLETLAKMSSFSEESVSRESPRSPDRSLSHQPLALRQYHAPRLPRLELPKFDGRHSQWLPFRDMFSSLVLSNVSISPVEKLQYLKTCLTGTAAQLLKNTVLTADNFQRAWDALVAFYENERLLVTSALQALFSLKKMTKESGKEMEFLYTSVMQSYRTLEALNRPIQHWDDVLVFTVVRCFDPESVKAWEHTLGSSKTAPTWQQLRDFMTTRMFSLQAFEKSLPGTSGSSQSKQSSARSHSVTAISDTRSAPCPLCKETHPLYRCPQYQQKTVPQRNEYVTQQNRCFNCLGPHRLSKCSSTIRCRKCAKRHHTTLHKGPVTSPGSQLTPTSTDSRAPAPTSDNAKSVNHARPSPDQHTSIVLLATAQVRVLSRDHSPLKARALLDQGSEISLVTEQLAQQLRVSRSSSRLRLLGVGRANSGQTRGTITLTLKPHFDSSFEIQIRAHILPKLTSVSSASSVDHSAWNHISSLALADPNYLQPGRVDIIVGADYYGQLLEGSIVKGPPGTPVAQLSSFGWVVSGPASPGSAEPELRSLHCTIDQTLSDLLERFWRQEEIRPTTIQPLSSVDQQCEDHFVSTHRRTVEGRYVVRLPFRLPVTSLGDSLPAAQRMLTTTRRKLLRDPQYSQAYSDFLMEYENLHHMVRVSETEPNPPQAFYLPHHGVIRESSSTTRLRVVFNGSCSVTSGLSLNEILHTGAKLQTDIFDVLIWFRQFKYTYTCDISKMYRQILLHPDDQPFQRILWHDGNVVQRFQLTTVTYGLACAPFLALRVMDQLTSDEGSNFPLACDVMRKGRYVDDIFGGADTIQAAQTQLQHVNNLCMAGGFPLRKWTSNEPQVLRHLPSQHCSPAMVVPITETSVHALGLSWNPTSDSFKFVTPTPSSFVLSKRSIVSRVAQFFDPLGFLAPVLIQAKIFIQELWAIKLSWDDALPASQAQSWNVILQSMAGIEDIQIPRWMGCLSSSTIELHGFCDASQSAMAAVVYLRVQSPTQEIAVSLICAKTKVAPLKRMTIPRLELSSAVLLTRLVAHTLRVLSLTPVNCILWTDSSIVLTWITNHPSRWKDYVHNRTCFIQETLPSAKWKHIAGLSNPADCASRGLSAPALKGHALWWTGPPWLAQDASTWPTPSLSPSSIDLLREERKSASIVRCHTVGRAQQWDLLDRYSSLTRLLRVTAMCKRVVPRARKVPNSAVSTPLSPDEVNESRQFWVKSVQLHSFAAEIKLLQSKTDLPRSSSLARLCPYLDDSGILRVRGRLHHSTLDDFAKHPYIIPRDSPFSTLIIRDAHEKTLHGSTQDTLCYIRNTFWILGGRTPVRSYILRCVKCTRYRQAQAQHLMGQLPPSRVNPSRAFLNSGLDYAGPFLLKTWKGRAARSYKAWVALFVCLATSAIHLEIVTDYTTEALIAAFKRFSARRGVCATLRSDCGTNFKGGDKQLRDLFSAHSSELAHFASLISQDGTKWIFNPPAAPHFGGKWEAGVKSMKFHLKRITDNTLLTYEDFSTVLAKIEAVLNSRPLCPLTEDPDDLNVLTPGHFLVGHSLSLIPEPSLLSIPSTRLGRWQRITQMLQSFWDKWSKEYLQRFHCIYKWNRNSPPPSVGQLVLVSDERYPPAKWPLGRIVELHPGPDSVIRVVTVRTATSVLKRPVVKISPLSIHAADD